VDAHELRELQRPLKQRYKDDPSAARVPARAHARLDPAGVGCTISTWRGETKSGLHAAAGGTGDLACSADMLLEALVACAGVTLASVATAMSVDIRSGVVTAEGQWDARGTLAVDREAPVGITDVTLTFDLDTDADAATLERLVGLTERYCVIAQTLAHPPAVAFGYRVVAGA
jgi:uncharacterized OsmC-like protein